ncbi:hypothetical protein BKA61DRAFT_697765 [Leptodontidium sp. MPI-SDFR-AT-0119]|nr:hypothetical protein BKA61DRAFT_697765 [Leptodontidium sp. MPI-SDFR-AT-0119]
MSTTIQSEAPFAITTTFTAPTQCAESVGGLTMLKNDGFRIWLNHPLPVPGTTITSCYAPEFASSFLLERGGVSQAAMSPVVCPAGYTTQGPFTSNYIACCPSGWDGLAQAANPPSDRPAFGGTCFSNIFGSTIRITSYDDSSVKASSLFTATNSLDQAFAYPYEGFALGVAIVASTTPPPRSRPTSTTSTSTSTSTSIPGSQTGVFSNSSDGSGSSNAGVLAGAIVGSILAALVLTGIIAWALHYRRKRLSTHALNPNSNFPDYGSHIRLNNDSPTPMVYLSQPPRMLVDYYGAKGIDRVAVNRYDDNVSHELPVSAAAIDQQQNIPRELEAQAVAVHEMDAGPRVPNIRVKSLPDLPPRS